MGESWGRMLYAAWSVSGWVINNGCAEIRPGTGVTEQVFPLGKMF